MSYVENELEGVEKNEIRALKLSVVISYREADFTTLPPARESSGTMKSLKVTAKASVPRDTEALGLRIMILGAARISKSYQQTNNDMAKDLWPFIFQRLADYPVGPHELG